jgi:hypothetical protein
MVFPLSSNVSLIHPDDTIVMISFALSIAKMATVRAMLMASNFTDNRRRLKACAAWPLTWGLGQIRGCAWWIGTGVANQQASTPRTGDCYRFRARKVPVGAPLKLHRIVIRTHYDDRWRISNRANVNNLPSHSGRLIAGEPEPVVPAWKSSENTPSASAIASSPMPAARISTMVSNGALAGCHIIAARVNSSPSATPRRRDLRNARMIVPP